MSIEQAQAFFEKVKNDEDLQKRLSDVQDSESKLEIARQEGFEFDLEEAKKAKDHLTEEDMELVTGGFRSTLCESNNSQDGSTSPTLCGHLDVQ